MNTQEKLTADMKEAMKAKDKATLNTVRLILAAIQRKAQDMKNDALKKGKPVPEITEDEVIQVITKFKDNIVEELEAFAKRGDTEKVKELDDSLAVTKKYLPEQLDAEQIFEVITRLATGAKNQGEVRKALGSELKGKADNKMVSEQIERFLKG